MNKRLAKKKRVGFYKEEGFWFSADFAYRLSPTELDRRLDDFIDFIESRGLCTYASCDPSRWRGVVSYLKKYQKTTGEDRSVVEAKLSELGASAVRISPNFNLWGTPSDIDLAEAAVEPSSSKSGVVSR